MKDDYFKDLVKNNFGYELSESQDKALSLFNDFLLSGDALSVFVLRGYAGTGKTSLVSSFISVLKSLSRKIVLMAPTGRAAKVFSTYSLESAFTIHKKIYREKSSEDGVGEFVKGFNSSSRALFFVDEASMISNSGNDTSFGTGRLLDDLVDFVYCGNGSRLVLIGDTAQLPPVNSPVSPALDKDFLESNYNLNVYEVDLTDVLRQASESGILYNATLVRSMLDGSDDLRFKLDNYPDVYRLTGETLLEDLETCYDKFGTEETIVLCRTNKRANKFNEGIRRTILYREEDFSSGDRVMVVKNNYYACKSYEEMDFIANGDIATVVKTGHRIKNYDFEFAEAQLLIDGYDLEIDALVMLDTLMLDAPQLTYEQTTKLYKAIESDYSDVASKRKRQDAIKDDMYYNALQLKFAYAITCHKAQGGQWDAVFIDQGWLSEDMINDDFWHWLYTAVTRARKRLYLLNFNKEFFD